MAPYDTIWIFCEVYALDENRHLDRTVSHQQDTDNRKELDLK